MNQRSALGSMFAPLLIHNLNETMANIRAQGGSVAVPAAGTVYPGSKIDQTINNATGWLKGALLGTALATAGAAGGLLLPGLVGSKPGAAPVSPAPVVAQPPAPPLGSQAFDEITETKQPDGSWLETDRQPFGTFPKGPKP